MREKNSLVEVRFYVSASLRERIRYHAQRIGGDMSAIVRDGVVAHLEFLDEKEIAIEEQKKQKKKQNILPSVPLSGYQRKTPAIPQFKRRSIFNKEDRVSTDQSSKSATENSDFVVDDKFKRSYRRWAEFIENSKDKEDAKIRAEEVMQDIRDRCSSKEDAAVVLEAFKAFMEVRTDSRNTAKKEKPKVIDVSGAKMFGDVD